MATGVQAVVDRTLVAARQAVVQLQLLQAQILVTFYKVLGGG